MILKFALDDVFVVTGATSGIGLAVAVALCEAGATVLALGRNRSKLDSHGLSALHFHEVDLATDPDQINKTVKSLAKQYGHFRGCVLAAGYQNIAPFGTSRFSKIKEMFDVNYYGNMAVAQAFSSKKVHCNNGASIVFVSSISSLRGAPGILPYAATKGAINSSVKSLALEYSKKNIRVNAILPGLVKTELIEKNSAVYTADYLEATDADYPLGLGQPEDVVKPILFLLSSSAKWITGTQMIVDGGASI